MSKNVLVIMFSLLISFPASATILYERDGHLFSTFIIAQLAFKQINVAASASRASVLARMSQYPDDCTRFSAYYVVTNYALNNKWKKDVMIYLHSFHGGVDKAVYIRREKLKNIVSESYKQGDKNDYRTGLIIHMLADSFAHTYTEIDDDIGFEELRSYDHYWGHATDGHAPDKIKNNKEKYKEYIKYLYSALSNNDNYEVLNKLFKIIDKSPRGGNTYLGELSEYANDLGYEASSIQCSELPEADKSVKNVINYVKGKI